MGKHVVISRIDNALRDVQEYDPLVDVPATWQYGQPTSVADKVALFIERVEDYKAVVKKAATAADIPVLIAECLARSRARNVALPPGLDPSWLAALSGSEDELRWDRPQAPLSKEALNATDAVITACACAFAETGTIALDHSGDQGRRILTLLPDTHICVVAVGQIVSDVPEGMARLAPAIRAGRPITWISGPSATSDIELSRVEGVHGPRNLYVLIAP